MHDQWKVEVLKEDFPTADGIIDSDGNLSTFY